MQQLDTAVTGSDNPAVALSATVRAGTSATSVAAQKTIASHPAIMAVPP